MLDIFFLVIYFYNSAEVQAFWLVNRDDTVELSVEASWYGNRLTQMLRDSGHTVR